jgi:hypothetical protein
MRSRRTNQAKRPSAAPASPPAPPSNLVRAEAALALIVTLGAGLLLGVFVTHATSLWRDEVSSVNTQSVPSLAEMWRLAEFESFPPLWMLLLRGWIGLGGGATDMSLRIFGLIGPAALIAAVWFAARRLGRWSPAVTLAVVATNPELLRWSATIRPWGLGAALAIAVIPLLWDATVAPTRRRIGLAALVAILSVQCLFQNAIFLAAVAAGAMAVAARRQDWRRIWVPLGIGAAAALSLLPHLSMIRRRGDWNALGSWPITFAELGGRFWAVVQAAGLVPAMVLTALVVAAAGVTAAVLLRTPGRHTDTSTTDHGAFAGLVLLFSLAGILVFYRLLQYPTQPWYYLGVITILGLCSETVLVLVLPGRHVGPIFILLTCIVLVAGGNGAWTAIQNRQTNIDVLASYLNGAVRPGDMVVTNPWFLGVTLSRYYSGPAAISTVPPIADQRVSRYDLLKAQMLRPDPMAPVLGRIESVLKGGHRVWLVGNYEPPPAGLTPADLRLPPPPLPERGWASAPYELLWSFQLGGFLRDHAVSMETVPPGVSGGPLEHATLHTFAGWH